MSEIKWGIDLTGRRMRFAPWPIDETGAYRTPTEAERRDVYGIGGQAVRENLEAFRACGGDVERLVSTLNDHAVSNDYRCSANELLETNRRYTNEFYFTFVMFCKKLLNDYAWRYHEGDGVQLSEDHKMYEKGFLTFVPFGEGVHDNSNSIPLSIIRHYTQLGYDFEDLYVWVDSLCQHKSVLSYRDDFAPFEHVFLSGELTYLIYEFLRILLNVNRFSLIVSDAFEKYEMRGLAFVPEPMLIEIFSQIIKRSTSYYDFRIERLDAGNVKVFLTKSAERRANNRCDVYIASTLEPINDLTIEVLKKMFVSMFVLKEPPEVPSIVGIDTEDCVVTFRWPARLSNFPAATVCAIVAVSVAASIACGPFGWAWQLVSLTTGALSSFVAVLARRNKNYRRIQETLEEKIYRISNDLQTRLNQSVRMAEELVREKKKLEANVSERTVKLQEANQRLQALDQLKMNFFANISHELRTPLALILGPVESILGGQYGAVDPRQQTAVEAIQFHSQRLLRLINDLLDFIKIEERKLELTAKVVDLGQVLARYVSIVQTSAEAKKIRVVFQNNVVTADNLSGTFLVRVDPVAFERALFNLFSNAIKFTPEGGSVVVQLDPRDDEFQVCVSDTGIGIPKEQWERIFEKFTQVDASMTRTYGGTGLGLALTKELVEAMQGTISVVSQVGRGSRFTVSLPRGNPESFDDAHRQSVETISVTSQYSLLMERSAQSQPIAETASIAVRPRVLIVEDSLEMRSFLKEALVGDYDVAEADDGKKALESMHARVPDLVVSDVMMPSMDGLTFVQNVKSEPTWASIPLLLISAKADVESRMAGLEYGADDYLVKPFPTDELRLKIKAQLAMKKLRDELVAKTKQLESALQAQRVAEGCLESIEGTFFDLAERFAVSLFLIAENKRSVWLNTAAQTWGGWDRSQISVDTLVHTIASEERVRFRKEILTLERTASDGWKVFRSTKADGTISTCFWHFVERRENGRPDGVIAVALEMEPIVRGEFLPEDEFYKRHDISSREREIVESLIVGLKPKEIGEKLFISESTVKSHLSHVYAKVGADNKGHFFEIVRKHSSKRFASNDFLLHLFQSLEETD